MSKREYRYWKTTELRALYGLARNGLSVREAAEILGRDYARTMACVIYYNLPFARRVHKLPNPPRLGL